MEWWKLAALLGLCWVLSSAAQAEDAAKINTYAIVGTGEDMSKVNTYTVIEHALDMSKLNSYAIIERRPLIVSPIPKLQFFFQEFELSKIVGYSVLHGADVKMSKITGYSVLSPNPPPAVGPPPASVAIAHGWPW